MPAGTPQDHLPLHIRWIQNLSRSVSGCSLPCCKRDDVTLAVSTVDAEACIRNITVVLAVYTTHADPSIAAEAVQVMIRVLRGLPRLRNAVLQGQASFARSQGLPDDHPEVLLHLQASKCTACSLPLLACKSADETCLQKGWCFVARFAPWQSAMSEAIEQGLLEL